MSKDDFNWFEWAGIPESDIDKLKSQAREYEIQVFDTDSTQDIFNRILAIRTYKSNRKYFFINIFLAALSCAAALVSVYNSL